MTLHSLWKSIDFCNKGERDCTHLLTNFNRITLSFMPIRARRFVWNLIQTCAFMCSLWGLAGQAAHAAGPMGRDDAMHLLTRTAFGASDVQIDQWAVLSRSAAIERLLTPISAAPRVPVPTMLINFERRLNPDRVSEAEFKRWQREQRAAGVALRSWWVDEMLADPDPAHQMRERMVLFWHNHFVSSNQKVHSAKLMRDQNQLFRDNALGRFSELLHAVGRDPAMLIYLDTVSNRKGSPNENFAREVMELFTLGEGHYSEADIKDAARAFTGWGVDRETGEFRWRPALHDDGRKTVLGVSGQFDGDAVLDILLAQDECSRFIVRKLWREFISPEPDEKQVNDIARRWRASNYDLKVALRALLESPSFWATENRLTLVKSPVDLLVGSLQSAEVKPADTRLVAMAMREMGQDLFVPPNVRGWPGGTQWINSNSLLVRKSAMERLLVIPAMKQLSLDDQARLRERWLAASYQVK